MSTLVTFLGDQPIGELERDAKGRSSFAYRPEWQRSPGAYPLSLSMPLALGTHPRKVVEPYLWGLLPDNEMILERWAKRFQVSARNAFGLLTHVGEDCPGAARFLLPDRAEEVQREGDGEVEWLKEVDIAARLRLLHSDASAWRTTNDEGQFSLGGAQPKTALLFDGKRWGVPSGRIPTTHILKPGSPDRDGHAENEHVCLTLARELDLPTATSTVTTFEDQVAIVIARYDRVRTGKGPITRVHQEDFCQALGVVPTHKHENDGGPGAKEIGSILRAYSRAPEEDVETFVKALAFNWLIAGTDAHAKNYSVLIGKEGRIRLAPLYDIASALPYEALRARKLKLAMKIGGKYRLHDIGFYEWAKLAKEVGLDPDHVRALIVEMSAAVPDLLADVMRTASKEGISHPVLTRLAKALRERATLASRTFGQKSVSAPKRA